MLEFFEIGQRLKEERERLGLSQAHFAGIGDLTKQAQINYEQGKRSPDTAYLAALAKHTNIDILYVVTGKRSITEDSMNETEVELLNSYRSFDNNGKKAIDAMVIALKNKNANNESDSNGNSSNKSYSIAQGSYNAQGDNASVSILGSDAKIESLTIEEATSSLSHLSEYLKKIRLKFYTHRSVWPFIVTVLFFASLPFLEMFGYSMNNEYKPYVVVLAFLLLLASMKNMFTKRKALFESLEQGKARLKLIENKYNRLYVERMLGLPPHCL